MSSEGILPLSSLRRRLTPAAVIALLASAYLLLQGELESLTWVEIRGDLTDADEFHPAFARGDGMPSMACGYGSRWTMRFPPFN
jgi:hypothetical protein